MEPELLRKVVETAVRAPSVHNTQPWRFAGSTDHIDVFADRSRLLKHQDPRGRELLVSCGATALHAWLAVRGAGYDCSLTWLPDDGHPDHVARLHVAAARTAGQEELQLLDAVPLRHTDRSAFSPQAVPAQVVHRLSSAVAREGASLDVEDREDRVLLLEVLVGIADRTLRQDAGLREELQHWVSGRTGRARVSLGRPCRTTVADEAPPWPCATSTPRTAVPAARMTRPRSSTRSSSC